MSCLGGVFPEATLKFRGRIRPRTPTRSHARSSLFHTLQHVYRAHITDLLRYILDRLRS